MNRLRPHVLDAWPSLPALVIAALTGACEAPPPWGSGAASLETPGHMSSLEQHLDAPALADATRQLMQATGVLRAEGLQLAGDAASSVVFAAARLPVARLAVLRDEDGRALGLEVPSTSLAWSGLSPATEDAACPAAAGTVALGPGRFTLPLAFATDDLGRLRPRVAARARWDGPFEAAEVPTREAEPCPPPDASSLAEALTRQLPPAVDLALGPELVQLLGLDLPAVLVSLRPAEDALPPPLDVRMRARATEPVGAAEDGVSAWFELAVSATPAPCVAPLALRDPPESPAYVRPPARAGLNVPVAALEAVLGAVTLAGHLCGADSAVGTLDGATIRALAPRWTAPFGDAPPATTVAWAPTSLPRLEAWRTADPTEPARLTLTLDGLELGLWAAWEGARWQLAAMTIDVSATLGLTVAADGRLTSRLDTVEVAVPVTRSGLLHPPAVEEARALAAAILRRTLDGRTLVTLPRSLTPPETRDALVDPASAHVVLPSR